MCWGDVKDVVVNNSKGFCRVVAEKEPLFSFKDIDRHIVLLVASERESTSEFAHH